MVQGRTRTVVVGAGAAGVPLAARLSEDPTREVMLLEAGPTSAVPDDLLDGSTIRGAIAGYRDNWVYDAELTPERQTTIARGRILGGSTTVNGGYFVRATRADFDRWAAIGGPKWRYDEAMPILRALERDLDFGAGPLHGDHGPMPVTRPPQTNPASAALISAAQKLGFPLEHDKNGQGEPGVGPVPSNIVEGIRINTGLAFLGRGDTLPHVDMRGKTRVIRVILQGGRAVGVELASGGIIEADEVVLTAGAVATPQLLMLSGVGPRSELALHDIPVVADLPVGTAFSDHPNLAFSWRTKPGVIDRATPFGFPTSLNFDASRLDPVLELCAEGDVEILLTSKPLEFLLTGADDGRDLLHFLIALQGNLGRGRLSLRSNNPFEPPNIEYHYLDHPQDRRRMRVAVRAAAQLLVSQAFANVFDGFLDINDDVLQSDDQLDAWILDHLGTALHMCGTAPMGAVVDGAGRVFGVEGLRVADTSILPTAPHRGPANTAVFIGDFIARQMHAGM